MTSTPNATGEVADTPDVSIIERTSSTPVLISAEYFEHLETDLNKKARVSALNPGICIVQRAGQEPTQQCGKENYPQTEDNRSHTQHLTAKLKQSVNTSAMQSKPNYRRLNAEKTHQTSFTKSCGEVTEKLNKSSSPFRKNCSLQTFLTTARQTSPLQISMDPNHTATEKCPESYGQSKLPAIFLEKPRPLRSIPSLSCPSSPRDSRRACPRPRSRSPSAGARDLIAETQRRTINTLKDIIDKASDERRTLTDGEPNHAQISDAESAIQRRESSKTATCCVHFTPEQASAASCPVKGDVQQLYFNTEMKCSCKQCALGLESQDSPRQRDTSLTNHSTGQTGASPRPAKCVCNKPQQPSTPSIQVVAICCSSSQQPPCPYHSGQAQTQPHESLQTQSPCKTDTGTGLSGTESLCSVNSASGACACGAKRAQLLQNKLHATQLCLKNKEETVRVQAESLTCAEQRIALLTIRAAQQRRELEACQTELCKLKGGTIKTEDGSCQTRSSSKTDVCCSTHPNSCCNVEANTEVENQKNMVVTLQNNLSIIEELYRECFYETVKQEELIEKLRKSYLDVRLMEKEKADRIGRLENVVNSQKWSLKTCQDVAMEVENLKLEILNFLNNSNNDSGMWEQSVAGEVGEDINDIMLQLHQLREVLQEESFDASTLKRENHNLMELNKEFECKINDMCKQKTEMEYTLREKDDTINRLRSDNIELSCEIQDLRSELEAAKKRIGELQNETGSVRKQLSQAQEEVSEAKTEIGRLQTHNEDLQRKNQVLSEELERADDIIKENCKIRSEVSYLSQQVALWRQQLADSEQRVHSVEAELARARSHVRSVDQCYREKVDAVAALEVQLQQAHARGAQLCAESRRAVATVRNWIQRTQDTNKEQSQKIKRQQTFISMLQKALQDRVVKGHEDTRPPPPPPPPDNLFPRESQTNLFPRESRQEFTIPDDQLDETQDMTDLVQESCEYYSTYHAQLSQGPFGGVGCSKCAAKRPADPSRSPTDDSDDILPVGGFKGPPKRKGWSKAVNSEITIDSLVGRSKSAPKRISKARKYTNLETESGSSRSQATNHNTSAGKSSGYERDDGTQACNTRTRSVDAPGCSHMRSVDAPSCSHIPVPPRRLLRNRLCNDRVAHYLFKQRCSAGPAREAAIQQPVRRDSCTSPSRIPVPRAVSPTGELLERVSRLSDAMEESQRRWSRSKLPQTQREHHR